MAKPTLENIEEFGRYIEEFQNLLNLRDWRLEASGKPAQKGALAQIAVQPEDRLAVWAIGKEWGPMPINSKTLRETALHEILHVFLRPLIDACASRDADAADAIEHSVIIVLEKLLSK